MRFMIGLWPLSSLRLSGLLLGHVCKNTYLRNCKGQSGFFKGGNDIKFKKTIWLLGRNSRKREEIKETKEQNCCCQKDTQQKREGEHKDCV